MEKVLREGNHGACWGQTKKREAHGDQDGGVEDPGRNVMIDESFILKVEHEVKTTRICTGCYIENGKWWFSYSHYC